MKRSVGVTAAAIVLFIGCAFGLLSLASTLLLSLVPVPSTPNVPMEGFALLFPLVFNGAVIAWGIATGVGILRLRLWARISIIAMSIFAIVTISFGAIVMLLMFPTLQNQPNMPADFGKFFLIGGLLIFAIPLAIAVWWLILFFLPSVRLQFAAPRGSSLPSQAEPADSTAVSPPAIGGVSPQTPTPARPPIPLSLRVISIILLVLTAFALLSLPYAIQLHIPGIIFGVMVTGWIAWTFLVLLAAVALISAIGILLRRAWAIDLAIAYFIFYFFNVLAYMVSPGREKWLAAMLHNMPRSPVLPPGYMDHMMHAVMPFSMITGAALSLVALYFLFTRRAAFRSACLP